MPLLALFGLFLLTACTEIPEPVMVIRPPEQFRECEDVPPKPETEKPTPQVMAKWAVAVWFAGEDCRSKLRSTWDFLDKAR
mgnify:CR=1 FL=1